MVRHRAGVHSHEEGKVGEQPLNHLASRATAPSQPRQVRITAVPMVKHLYEHYMKCLAAGVKIAGPRPRCCQVRGIRSARAPDSRWEITARWPGTSFAWASCMAEFFHQPKACKGDWSRAVCHTNFSVKSLAANEKMVHGEIERSTKIICYFGLSGTSKTTLSADSKRVCSATSSTCGTPRVSSTPMGGCSAKTMGLTREKEPEIIHFFLSQAGVLESWR